MTFATDDPILRRAQAYRLLSSCYDEPDDAFARKVVALANETGAEFRELATSVRASADGDALRHDYVRLFIGPFKALAPPYGSVYLESDRRLMGESTVDAAACYAEDGLTNTLREPPDHIIVELEYLSFLAGRGLSADSIGNEQAADYWADREQRFLATHIARWAPAFCRDVETHAETAFYRTLAQTTHSFIEAVSGNGVAIPMTR